MSLICLYTEPTETGIASFLELVFTYWPIALGILVLIIFIIITWIGCHFTREARQKKAEAKNKEQEKIRRKKKRKDDEEESDLELGKRTPSVVFLFLKNYLWKVLFALCSLLFMYCLFLLIINSKESFPYNFTFTTQSSY